MKPTLLAVIFLSVLCQAAYADAWQPTLEKANEVATARKLPVFVYFSADWCAPCRVMKRDVIQSAAFTEWTKDRFVLVEIKDASSMSVEERESARKIWTDHKIEGIPTIVILSPSGRELGRTGSCSLSELKSKFGLIRVSKNE